MSRLANFSNVSASFATRCNAIMRLSLRAVCMFAFFSTPYALLMIVVLAASLIQRSRSLVGSGVVLKVAAPQSQIFSADHVGNTCI